LSNKSKKEILQETAFGNPVAEQERKLLSSYFVETEQWRQVFAGDIDIVYGPKGSGKSALYSLLLGREADLLQRSIVVVAAENPQESLAFKDIVADPPADENQFRGLWKLYFLVLLGTALRHYELSPHIAKDVIRPLEEASRRARSWSADIAAATIFHLLSMRRGWSMER
jgi:ABC-type arginine transport system ATPase subunit